MATSTKRKKEKRKESAAKRRARKHNSGDRTTVKSPDGVGFLKVKEGVMKLDILGFEAGKGNPFADPGEMHYERTFFVHRGIGPENASYVCPRKTAGKKCPICEHLAKLNKDSDADPDLIKALAPKERQLFQVINHAERDKGIQLLEIAHFNFGKRLDAEVRDAEDDEGIDEFYQHSSDNGGKTLKVGFIEDSFAGQSFHKADTVKFLDRAKAIDPDLLENVMCLDDLIIVPDYDDLKKVYMQQEDDEDDEDEDDTDTDDDDKEDKHAKKNKKVKPKKEEEEDDDEEEEEDEGEESEDDDDKEEDEEESQEDEDDKYGGFKKGDKVTGVYKKKAFKGTVKKLVKGIIHIETEDGDFRAMKADELAVVKSSKKKGKPVEDDEDEDDEEVEEDSELEEEDEDDEEGEEEDEDEDGEEEPPKKKSKTSKTGSKKASKKDEEDEDEEMDIDDEDEDEDD